MKQVWIVMEYDWELEKNLVISVFDNLDAATDCQKVGENAGLNRWVVGYELRGTKELTEADGQVINTATDYALNTFIMGLNE